MESVRHRVFVGAETGLLKAIDPDSEKWENRLEISNVKRSNGICVMCWSNQQEDQLLYGTVGGLVSNYDLKGEVSTPLLQVTSSESQLLRGICVLDGKYVTCTSDGKLSIWDENQDEKQSDQVIVDCGADIYRMRQNPFNPHLICTGGKENDLKLWDLENDKCTPIFTAKNVRDDFLDLRVPIWVYDIGFLKSSTDSHLIVTATGHYQIRLYDTRVQRRPVVDITWGENPLISCSVNPHQDRQLMVGNAIGDQGLIDLRNKQTVGKYKGAAGAIRSVSIHPNKPIVVSCGLDRYARIHDLQSRKLLHKIYLKSRLNCMLLSSIWDKEEPIDDAVNDITSTVEPVSGDEEDVWQELEHKSAKTRKHKTLITEKIQVIDPIKSKRAKKIKDKKPVT